MAKIPRSNSGLSREYFVAAELYRRGWSVGMTVGNAKAIDLFAEKGNKLIALQVKAIYQKKNAGWPIKITSIQDNCIYIFVNLNADKMSPPDYFLATAEEVRENIKQYSKREIINLSPLNNSNFKNNWSKLELLSEAIGQ